MTKHRPDPNGPRCGFTKLLREECYHCPLPEPATAVEPGQALTPEAVTGITEAARQALLTRPGSRWWLWENMGTVPHRCCLCGRTIEERDPVEMVSQGRTARDLDVRAWCCEQRDLKPPREGALLAVDPTERTMERKTPARPRRPPSRRGFFS